MGHVIGKIIWWQGDEYEIKTAPDKDGFQKAHRLADAREVEVLAPEKIEERTQRERAQREEQQAAFRRLHGGTWK